MDDDKRNLKGSERRDLFKRKHKDLNMKFWACDADLCLIDKKPPGVVAYLDYKTTRDNVTFSEGILYNDWAKTAPVYIIESDDPESGPFTIRRLFGVDWRPNPVVTFYEDEEQVKDWGEFEQWEQRLRDEYRRRGGWNGNLRVIEF